MDSYVDHVRHGNNYMRRNDETIEPQGHATDLFSGWAVEHFRNRAKLPDQPFFLYLAYNAPHFPIEPPAEWLAKVQQRSPQLDEKRAKNVELDVNGGPDMLPDLARLAERSLDHEE